MPIHLLAAIAIVCTMPTTPAPAQPAPPQPVIIEPLPADWSPPASRNAALLYHRAWLTSEHMFEQFHEFDWGRDDPSMPPELTLWLKNNQQFFIDPILRASAQPTADWGIEYELGVGVLLDHLGLMRSTVRVLSADARRLMADDRPDEAAARIAAIYGCALNIRSDRWLISSLVVAAIVNLANSEVDHLIESAELTPKARQTLLVALGRFDMDDPFAMRAALISEGRTITLSLDEELAPFKDQINLVRAFYDEAAMVWHAPDAPERLADLGNRADQGEFGMMAGVLVPAVTKTHEADFQARQALIETRQRLQDAIDPAPGPAVADPIVIRPLRADWSAPTSRNAALLYYRAWRVANFMFDQFADTNWRPDDPALPPEVVTILDDNQDIIERLLRAASQPTADWGLQYEQGQDMLLPHLGRMQQTATMLAADAHRFTINDLPDVAAHRIAAIYGCALHLRSDRTNLSTIISIKTAALANAEVLRLIESGTMSPGARDTLLAALSRFDANDPFAMRAAVITDGRYFTRWLEVETAGKGKRAGHRLAQIFLQTGPVDDNKKRAFAAKLRTMDQAAANDAINKLRNYHEQAGTIWIEPDAPEQLDALEERIASGEFGPLSLVYAPSLRDRYERDAKARQALIETRRRLIKAGP